MHTYFVLSFGHSFNQTMNKLTQLDDVISGWAISAILFPE
jgi:hypothetical protein